MPYMGGIISSPTLTTNAVASKARLGVHGHRLDQLLLQPRPRSSKISTPSQHDLSRGPVNVESILLICTGAALGKRYIGVYPVAAAAVVGSWPGGVTPPSSAAAVELWLRGVNPPNSRFSVFL